MASDRRRKPPGRLCSIDGCVKPLRKRGWCGAHYWRWQQHGDPMGNFIPPNEHATWADGSCTLTITRSDGSRHVCRYDAADADLVRAYRWHFRPDGYVASRDGRDPLFLHHLVTGTRATVGSDNDHIDGDRLNNCQSNLRVVPHVRNTQNRAIVNGRGTSRFRGVCWHSGCRKWMAYVQANRRKYSVGYFDTEEAAAAAVARFRAEHGLPLGY